MTNAFWYAAGIVLALIALQLLAQPLAMMMRLLGNSVVGGLLLWSFNAVGGYFGLHVALNPVSAVVVGILGLPGAAGLGAIRFILG